jgi:hypothetical protein
VAALGTNVSFSSWLVENTPTLLEPNAATYSVAPSGDTASAVGVARLASFVLCGLGTTP